MPGSSSMDESVKDLIRSFAEAPKDEALSHQAEIAALRTMTDTLSHMSSCMQELSGKVSAMHTDIAVMKEKDRQFEKITDTVKDMEIRVRSIETLHAEQAGGFKIITFLKEFGPWLVALMLAAWGLFERKP